MDLQLFTIHFKFVNDVYSRQVISQSFLGPYMLILYILNNYTYKLFSSLQACN